MIVYKNTRILGTKDDNSYDTLVVDGDKIAYIGNGLPERFASAKSIDLSGKAIHPMFVDSHIHYSSYATFSAGLMITNEDSLDAVFSTIEDYMKRSEGLVLGFGLSAWSLKEQRLPNREELDKVCSRKLFIVKYDGHAAVANSALLEALPVSVKQLRGFDANSGLIQHEAFYAAVEWVTSSVSIVDVLKNVNRSAYTLLERGFAEIHAAEGVGFKNDMDIKGLMLAARGLPIDLRLFFQTMDLSKVKALKLPRVGGCFSCALDGCFGAKDAALHEPYSDDPNNRGILFYSQEQVDKFVMDAHTAGIQVAMHAIVDRAVTQAVDAFEKAIKKHPRDDIRHIIIHASLVREEDKDRMAQLGLQVATQPAMLHLPQEPMWYLEGILGKRAERAYPIRSLAERGIRLSFGSDGPVLEPRVGDSLYSAVNHPNKEEAISVEDALRMHSANGFESIGETSGTLNEGRVADFVVLNTDPLSMSKEDLRELNVEQVIRNGKPVNLNAGGVGRFAMNIVKGYLAGRKV